MSPADMSPMPSYNMDSVMATPERLSPSPMHSPGEILSPRELKSPGEAEKVVPVDHVEDVINRVLVPPAQKEQDRYITKTDLENALQMMKLQLVTEISSEARSLTPIIAMSLTNLAITNEKKDDLFSYKHQVVRSVPYDDLSMNVRSVAYDDLSHHGKVEDNSNIDIRSSVKQSESYSVLNHDDDDETIASEIKDEVADIEQESERDLSDVDVIQKPKIEFVTRESTQEESVVSVVPNDQQEDSSQSRMPIIEDEDDLSNLIDNDEDAFETDNYDSMISPSPRVVNYLTNIETQSSYLRRQRLTAASTLDLPQGIDDDDVEDEVDQTQGHQTDNKAVTNPPKPDIKLVGPEVDSIRGKDLRKQTFTLNPSQSLLMQTLNTDNKPVAQGWLARKVHVITNYCLTSLPTQVIGNAKKPFYDRRPQSRIRINTAAHAGFCGMCGPCSCAASHRTTPASSAGTTGEHGSLLTMCNVNLGMSKYGSRLRVDTYWNKSTIPEKFRKKEKPERMKVKVILEADEAASNIES